MFVVTSNAPAHFRDPPPCNTVSAGQTDRVCGVPSATVAKPPFSLLGGLGQGAANGTTRSAPAPA